MKMDLNRFNADDIHELRLLMAEERKGMTEDEIIADIKKSAAEFERMMEELRRGKQKSA